MALPCPWRRGQWPFGGPTFLRQQRLERTSDWGCTGGPAAGCWSWRPGRPAAASARGAAATRKPRWWSSRGASRGCCDVWRTLASGGDAERVSASVECVAPVVGPDPTREKFEDNQQDGGAPYCRERNSSCRVLSESSSNLTTVIFTEIHFPSQIYWNNLLRRLFPKLGMFWSSSFLIFIKDAYCRSHLPHYFYLDVLLMYGRLHTWIILSSIT